MILVRDIFHLKFGKAREAKELLKGIAEVSAKIGFKFGKVMTDLTGRSYTMVMETEFESLSDFENEIKTVFSNKDWQKWYKDFLPLVDNSYREIYTVLEN